MVDFFRIKNHFARNKNYLIELLVAYMLVLVLIYVNTIYQRGGAILYLVGNFILIKLVIIEIDSKIYILLIRLCYGKINII